MSTTLREVLAARADAVGPPDLDIGELVGLGEGRLRRRRLTVLLGAAAVVFVIVVALAIGIGLDGSGTRSDAPVDRPTPAPKGPLSAPVRKIVYSDGTGSHTTIHFGDRAVEVGKGPLHVDVTDDGIVYATGHGRLWFSDGRTATTIAPHACGSFSHYDQNSVMSANAGSLVAWFDCTDAAAPALVVLDTGTGREVFHQPLTFCRPGQGFEDQWCGLEAVIGEHVYFSRHFSRDGLKNPVPASDRLFSFDLTTGRKSRATPQSYAEDVRSQARGLLIGETPQTGTPTDGIGQSFRVVGSRLVPEPSNGTDVGARVFDTRTGRALRLQLPEGSKIDGLVLYEWLDDDTVALTAGGGLHSFGIVTCRLSHNRCDLTVQAAHGVRVVPHLPLPG